MTALRDAKNTRPEIEYSAPAGVREAIAAIGRTEDVRFSPDNRRLAIAAFKANRIFVFDVDVRRHASGPGVSLIGVAEIASADLHRPHGVDFIDDATIIVANRSGDACIFELPPGDVHRRTYELSPVHMMRVADYHLLASPGSVRVDRGHRSQDEILICNNSGHTVTRHVLDRTRGYSVDQGRVLVKKWLDIPDGVSVSRDRRWMAVSNHNTHNVLMYESPESLTPDADPDGVLRGVHCPHGLRFSSDGSRLFVADAGAPYIHVYASGYDRSWRGVRAPITSVRVMDEARFLRGRHNPQEGGPKGLDIDDAMNVLVVTSEYQPLAFFDPSAILDGVAVPVGGVGRQTLQIRYQLDVVGRGWKVARWARSMTADARARIAPVVKGLLAPRRVLSPLRRKS